VVLADPGLIEVELIQVLDQLEVLVQGQGRVFADAVVERGHEDAELHALGPIRHVRQSFWHPGASVIQARSCPSSG
jgi:hypothetical protein